jgi:hypothetical protein
VRVHYLIFHSLEHEQFGGDLVGFADGGSVLVDFGDLKIGFDL